MRVKPNAFRCGVTPALYVLVAVALLTGAATKPGVERWSIKTSLVPGVNISSSKGVSFIDLINLDDPPGVTMNDRRFQDALIPAFPNALGVNEGDLISVSGWLHLVAGEADGDYHIQISGSQASGNRCLIVEAPNPDSPFVTNAIVSTNSARVRKFIFDKVLLGQNPSSSGTLVEPVFVTVTGQLFYDDSHVGGAPRGKKGMKAATLWELHPLTNIRLAQP
jgi:hypothetical protein